MFARKHYSLYIPSVDCYKCVKMSATLEQQPALSVETMEDLRIQLASAERAIRGGLCQVQRIIEKLNK